MLGPPGAGKTGALFTLGTKLRDSGHDVGVLAAELLDASGSHGLGEDLGLQRTLYDALLAWPGDQPAFLLIDALDAARGQEASSTLLSLVSRVATKAGRWRVIASVRSFDLRHNRELKRGNWATADRRY